MKELTVFEMDTISGGYSWDFSSIQSTVTSLVSNGVEAAASAATGAITWGSMACFGAVLNPALMVVF